MFDMNKIRGWYRNVPTTKTLDPFSKDVVRGLVNIHKAINFPASKVKIDNNCSTAYTDLENIYISGVYCSWNNIIELMYNSRFRKELNDNCLTTEDKVLYAFSIYNTFFFHEYNHILHTEKIHTSNKRFNMIFNIIEDMYINSISMKQNINIFFKVLYTLFYDNKEYEDYLRYKKLVEDGVETPHDYFHYVMGFLFYLNFDQVVEEKFDYHFLKPNCYTSKVVSDKYDEIIHAFGKLFSGNFQDRQNLASLIHSFLFEFNKQIDDDLPQYQFAVFGENETSKFSFKSRPDGVMQDALDAIKNGNMYPDNPILETRIKVTNVIENSNQELKMDSRLKGFGKKYRYQNGIDRRQSVLYNSGKRIVEDSLVNYFIDGKIFDKDEDWNDVEKKPETVILVDLSASMSGRIYTVLSAVCGFCDGLKKANFPFSVWGHTTRYSEGAYLVNAFCHNMKDGSKKIKRHKDMKGKLQKLLGVDRNTNDDYIAINYVCENGYTGKAKKVLIVASDGEPSKGGPAVDETIKVINSYRRKGYVVFALSLTDSVQYSNDKIYGKEFNLKAYGNHLPEALRQLGKILAKR